MVLVVMGEVVEGLQMEIKKIYLQVRGCDDSLVLGAVQARARQIEAPVTSVIPDLRS